MASTALQRHLGRNSSSGSASASRARTALARARQESADLTRLVVTDGESAGTLAVCAVGEGYYGPDFAKVGGVDVRGVLGLGLMVIGGYRKTRRKRDGAHLHAVGQGAAHSVIASWGVRRGQRMAAERGRTPTTTQTEQAPEAAAKGVDGVGEWLREVKLDDSGLRPAQRI